MEAIDPCRQYGSLPISSLPRPVPGLGAVAARLGAAYVRQVDLDHGFTSHILIQEPPQL